VHRAPTEQDICEERLISVHVRCMLAGDTHQPVCILQHEYAAVAAVVLLRYIFWCGHRPVGGRPRLVELCLRLVAGVANKILLQDNASRVREDSVGEAGHQSRKLRHVLGTCGPPP